MTAPLNSDAETTPSRAVVVSDACSASVVAALVTEARDKLAEALRIIEKGRKTYPGGRWRPGMRTRAEGEGKYGLRRAMTELRAQAEWLEQDSTAPNGGWQNTYSGTGVP